MATPRHSTIGRLLAIALALTMAAAAQPVGAISEPSKADELAREAREAGDPTPFIVNGEELGNPGFLVFVEIALANGFFGSCTGTLVHPSWVLTAAHCLDGSISSITASTGADDLRLGAVRTASAWVQHPGWDGRYGEPGTADLGLIRLSSPATGYPVAGLNADGRLPDLYQPLVIAGWGDVRSGPPPTCCKSASPRRPLHRMGATTPSPATGPRASPRTSASVA